jgi:hypothetical protein
MATVAIGIERQQLGPKLITELNQKIVNIGGVSSFQYGALADRPAAGAAGKIYVADDKKIYRDNGALWEMIGGSDVAEFTGATELVAGTAGLVKAPAIGDREKFLKGNGTWATVVGGVTSVNTKTGAVTLTATDVNAVPYAGTTSTIGQFDSGSTAPVDITARMNFNGIFYATKVYNAVYNDYAEYFLKDEELDPGDVVTLNPNSRGYLKSRKKYDSLVVGVVSDTFGHLLGGEGKNTDEEKYVPVGLAGKVNVKVTGTVVKGNLLVSSDIPGVAIASYEYIPGTVIGKALESHNGTQVDRISMLIMNA